MSLHLRPNALARRPRLSQPLPHIRLLALHLHEPRFFKHITAELAALTLVDFAVVRRKAEIFGHLQDVEAIVELLCAECATKPNHSHEMGFWL